MKKLHLLLGLIAILGLSACSSTVTQGELKKGTQSYSTYQLNDQSQVSTNTNIRNAKKAERFFNRIQDRFSESLTKELNRYGYTEGVNGVEINYNIDEYVHGGRFARWWFGLSNMLLRTYGVGVGKTVVEVNVKDRKTSLGELKTKSEIYAGFFGGSSFNTIDDAAKDIAKKIHEAGILKSSK